MNKKGFTLVELIVTIALIAILSIIVTPAVISIRNSVLKSSLESKISLINSAAKEYASKTKNLMRVPSPVDINDTCIKDEIITSETACNNNCLKVYVKVLLEEGYLAGDKEDKSVLVNPVTGESLNNKLVCVRYDTNDALNRKLISYIEEESELLK